MGHCRRQHNFWSLFIHSNQYFNGKLQSSYMLGKRFKKDFSFAKTAQFESSSECQEGDVARHAIDRVDQLQRQLNEVILENTRLLAENNKLKKKAAQPSEVLNGKKKMTKKAKQVIGLHQKNSSIQIRKDQKKNT